MSEAYRFFNSDSVPAVVGHFTNVRGTAEHKIYQEFFDQNYEHRLLPWHKGALLQFPAINLNITTMEKAFLESPELIYGNVRLAMHEGQNYQCRIVVGKHFLHTQYNTAATTINEPVAYVAYPKDVPLESIAEEDTTLYINKNIYTQFPSFSRVINKMMSTYKGKVEFVNNSIRKNIISTVKIPTNLTMAQVKTYNQILVKRLLEKMKEEYA